MKLLVENIRANVAKSPITYSLRYVFIINILIVCIKNINLRKYTQCYYKTRAPQLKYAIYSITCFSFQQP